MINATMTAKFAGRFKFEAFKTDSEGNEIPGSRRIAADWFDNIITNNGLDWVGNTAPAGAAYGGRPIMNAVAACRVGSGSTPAAATDTGLVSHIAGTSTQQANLTGHQTATAPQYNWYRRTFRFSTGVAAGNLSEVGIFTALTGGICWSRALIEAAGVPTTITILSDETLDVIYELRLYVTQTDAASTIVISGVNYNTVVRAANGNASSLPGWELNTSPSSGQIGLLTDTPSHQTAYATQVLGAITGIPAGAGTNLNHVFTKGSYTNGTYYLDHTCVMNLNSANVAGGIGSFVISTVSLGSYQISVTPKIPKDATKKLTIGMRVGWGRYTI